MDFAAAVSTYPEYQQPLISAFTNGAGEIPTDVLNMPSEALAASTAVVTFEVAVAGPPENIYPGQRAAIKQALADSASVSPDEIIITFLKRVSSSSRRHLVSFTASGKRKLETVETVIVAKIFVADTAAADAAAALMPQDAAALQQLPEFATAFSGLTVNEVETFTTPEWDVPFGSVGILGAVLLILGFFTCFAAKACARNNLKASGEMYTGCCDTGCCSFFAVKMWAFSELIALAVFAGCLFFLYMRMDGLTGVFINLVDIFVDIMTSEVEYIQSFTSTVPSGIIDTLQQYKDLVRLLPFAVMGPGALALVFMLVAAICPCGKCNKGGYCVTKCMIMLANVVLLLALIFYAIFAAVSLALKYAPPSMKEQLNTATSMCEVVPATVNQLVEDNSAALTNLQAAGANTTELDATLDMVRDLASTLDDGCENILQLFVEFNLLFLPGLMCVIAILFAMYVNNALCCAAGCCKRNARADEDTTTKGVEFSSSVTTSSSGYAAP
jgi:hypothetical protein